MSRSPIAPGSTYVALGSSMAAGPGIPPIVDRGAMRSASNYPHQVAAALDLRLVDVTCSGATTANLLVAGQRTWSGRRAPQIEAVGPDTDLVTVTVGGNDIGYIGGLTIGSVRTSVAGLPMLPGFARSRLRDHSRFGTPPAAVTEVAGSLIGVIGAVRAAAPAARIVLVDYLTMIGAHAATSRRLPLTDTEQALVRATADGLAAAYLAAAERTGAELVQASAASVDHGIGSPEPWVTGFEWANPLAGVKVPYHPNLAGMTAVARLVVAHLNGSEQRASS